MTKKYYLHTVKKACDSVFLKTINDRTFRNWKRKLGIKPYSDKVTTQESIYLLNYAYLTRINRSKRVTLAEVINFTYENENIVRELSKKIEDLEECKGSELPEIIFKRTGRRISIRTLYRYSQPDLPFRVNQVYYRQEVTRWCQLVA